MNVMFQLPPCILRGAPQPRSSGECIDGLVSNTRTGISYITPLRCQDGTFFFFCPHPPASTLFGSLREFSTGKTCSSLSPSALVASFQSRLRQTSDSLDSSVKSPSPSNQPRHLSFTGSLDRDCCFSAPDDRNTRKGNCYSTLFFYIFLSE